MISKIIVYSCHGTIVSTYRKLHFGKLQSKDSQQWKFYGNWIGDDITFLSRLNRKMSLWSPKNCIETLSEARSESPHF